VLKRAQTLPIQALIVRIFSS